MLCPFCDYILLLCVKTNGTMLARKFDTSGPSGKFYLLTLIGLVTQQLLNRHTIHGFTYKKLRQYLLHF